MADEMVTVELTRKQLACVRMSMFLEIQRTAELLADDAHQAHESGGVGGADARCAFVVLSHAAEVLDALGWDTQGDQEVIIEAEAATLGRSGGEEA